MCVAGDESGRQLFLSLYFPLLPSTLQMLTAQSLAYYHANLIQLIKKQFSKFGPKRPWNLEFYFLWFRSSPQRHSNTNNHQNSILSSLPSFPHPPPPSQHSLSVFFIESFHDNNFQKYWNRSIEIICNQTIPFTYFPPNGSAQRVWVFSISDWVVCG